MRRFSSLPIPAPLTLPPLPFTHPYQFHHLPCIPLCLLSLPPHPQFHVVVILLMAGAPVGHPCSLHSFVLSSFDFLPSRSFGFDIRSTRNKGSHNPCFFLPPLFPSLFLTTHTCPLSCIVFFIPPSCYSSREECMFFCCVFLLLLLLPRTIIVQAQAIETVLLVSISPYPHIHVPTP